MFIYLDCHSFSYAYIYPVIYIVSLVARSQFPSGKKLPIDRKFPFIFPFLCSLAETSCGVILLFRKCYKKYTKELREKEIIINSGSTQIKKISLVDKSKEIAKLPFYFDYNLKILIPLSLGNFCITFLCFCMDGVERIQSHNYTYQIGTLSIIWLSFLCHKWLGMPIYRHHYIAIVIICFCQIVLGFYASTFDIPISELLLDFSLLFLCDLFFSTKHVIEKYLMEKRNMLVFKLIFIEGIIGLIINIVFVSVFFFIPCPSQSLVFCAGYTPDSKPKFTADIDKLISNLKEFPFSLFMFYLLSIGVDLFVLLTNKFFSPAHRFVFDTISGISQNIIKAILDSNSSKTKTYLIVIKYTTYGIILIGCLIYTEILVFNFCGIGDFTKNKIIKRSIDEQDEDIVTFYDIGLTPGLDRTNSSAINLVNSEQRNDVKNEIESNNTDF